MPPGQVRPLLMMSSRTDRGAGRVLRTAVDHRNDRRIVLWEFTSPHCLPAHDVSRPQQPPMFGSMSNRHTSSVSPALQRRALDQRERRTACHQRSEDPFPMNTWPVNPEAPAARKSAGLDRYSC